MSFGKFLMNRLAIGVLGIVTVGLPVGEAVAQSASRPLDESSYIEVARQVLPSVVNITVERKREEKKETATDEKEQKYEDLLQYFLDQRGEKDSGYSVSGSGVVIEVKDGKGYVLTNNHVVATVDERYDVRLTFHQKAEGGTEYNQTTEITGDAVKILGRDRLSDLAVIEFSMPEGFVALPIEFADSDMTEIGEHVLALGNPLELNHTVTRGIISGKSRYLGQSISIERLLQTDAVIQPGNSGGPLVNLDGRIVGINNAIASRNGLWQGTSFAIPSNDARRISTQLMGKGRVLRGYLGVNMRDVMFNPEVLEAYALKREEGGVFIYNVVRNSPADVAGVHVEDVVLRIDGELIQTADGMLQKIARMDVDTTVTIEVARLDDQRKPIRLMLPARLGERPDETIIEDMHRVEPSTAVIPRIQNDPDAVESRDYGLVLESYFDPQNPRIAGLRVKQVAPASAGLAAGIMVGDVITMVNGRNVRSQGDFRAATALSINGRHRLSIQRDGKSMVVYINE